VTTSLFIAGAGAAPLTAAPGPTTPKATAPITATLAGLGCTTSVGGASFEARSWSWGATMTGSGTTGGGGGAGKAVIDALTLSRVSDACSPKLFEAVVTGRHFTTFTLSQFDKDGVLRATVVLNEVFVKSWHVGGTNVSAEAAEEVELQFDKLTFKDEASGNTFSWDLIANREG